MNAILERISQAGDIFVDFAWPMLIQSGVLILILLVVDLLLRKRVRAVFRYWIWMLVLVKLVLPTSLSSPLSLGNWFGDKLARMPITQTRAGSAVELPQATLSEALPNTNLTRTEAAPAVVQNPTITQVEQHETAVEPMRPVGPPVIIPVTLSWRAVLFLGWLAVVAAMGLLLMQRMIFVRGLIEQAGPADGSMKDVLDNCCRRVGVKRKIGIKLSNNATSPAVCGLYRPVILVPQNIAASLNQDQLQVVLLHELAHIKRGDLWVNFVQTILQIIYFYNPLLWLANAIIRRVREQAVDEMVLVAMGEQAGQYPQTLVSVAKLAFERPALSLRLIGVVESKSALTGRIKRILSRPIPKTAKLGIISLLVIVIAAAFLLPMAKEDAFGGWFGKEKLIKFSSDDKPTGTSKGSGDTTTYSKNYTVKFRKGEKLAIVAELYQVGKPMRSLGCKIFSGSEQPQELSIFLEKNHLNEEKTSVKHELRVTLGDQDFRLNDIFVDTLEIFSVTEWGFFNGPEIVAQKRKGEPYAEFENLLSIRVCPNGGRPRAPRIWMPTYNNVTWIDSDAYFIWVNMLPLSQLDNLRLTVPNFYEKLQLPDGTYLSPNASRDERTAVVDDYILNLKRALMREQMPLPELTAHKYYKVGEPIHISVDGGGGDWKPTLDEIYHGDDFNPVFFLIDGEEYPSRHGFGPFSGWGRKLHIPSELYVKSDDFQLPVGRHTIAYGWKDLNVVNPEEPDRVVHYDRLVTNAAEFEVVEEMPADYYSEVYEEGWEDILYNSIETPFSDNMRKYGISGPLLALGIKSLPFDIAFEIYAQAEGSEEREYAGRVAKQANSIPHIMGCDREVEGLSWDTVGEKRWRLILVPSEQVAAMNPPVHHYYGREFVTDWAAFEKSERFEQRYQNFLKDQEREKIPTYGGTIKADKPVDLDRLGRRWRGETDEVWPLPEGFELGWSPEDGGVLRIDPDSNIRMLWFPEANARLVYPTAQTRERLVELLNSQTAQINPPAGEPTLIAVQSSEGKIYFVRVSKVNETWANLSWWQAEESKSENTGMQVEVQED